MCRRDFTMNFVIVYGRPGCTYHKHVHASHGFRMPFNPDRGQFRALKQELIREVYRFSSVSVNFVISF